MENQIYGQRSLLIGNTLVEAHSFFLQDVEQSLGTFNDFHVGLFGVLDGAVEVLFALLFLVEAFCLGLTVDRGEFSSKQLGAVFQVALLSLRLHNDLVEGFPLFLKFSQHLHQLVVVVLKRGSGQSHF